MSHICLNCLCFYPFCYKLKHVIVLLKNYLIQLYKHIYTLMFLCLHMFFFLFIFHFASIGERYLCSPKQTSKRHKQNKRKAIRVTVSFACLYRGILIFQISQLHSVAFSSRELKSEKISASKSMSRLLSYRFVFRSDVKIL